MSDELKAGAEYVRDLRRRLGEAALRHTRDIPAADCLLYMDAASVIGTLSDACGVASVDQPSELETMRAAFEAWVTDRGCDTDGAWSAWQAAWNRRTDAGRLTEDKENG